MEENKELKPVIVTDSSTWRADLHIQQDFEKYYKEFEAKCVERLEKYKNIKCYKEPGYVFYDEKNNTYIKSSNVMISFSGYGWRGEGVDVTVDIYGYPCDEYGNITDDSKKDCIYNFKRIKIPFYKVVMH